MKSIQCTVIIPAYNAEGFIKECLDSVFSHNTKFLYEVIVVDDGSTDNTSFIIATHFPNAILIKKQNGGPGSARNIAAKAANSNILVFMDADDIMLPGRIDHQIGFMIENPHIKLTFGNQNYQKHLHYNANKENGLCQSDNFEIVKNIYNKLVVEGNFISNTSTAVAKDIYLKIGGQPEDIFVGEDYLMCCKISKDYPIAACSKFYTWYRQEDHKNLMSSSHTYIGPLLVLANQLRCHSDLLSKTEYDLANKRLLRLLNMLLGYYWTIGGHSDVKKGLKDYSDFISKAIMIKWNFLSLLPPIIPRMLRKIKHFGRTTHR